MSEKGLVLKAEQDFWTDTQVAALKQIGLASASQGDLKVFFHQSQRTGLDPFARQIYMIARGGKYTIQTSIDGFRIVAQRSGNYGGQTPAEWCGEDGVWKDVWLSKTPPLAARIGVYYKDASNPTYAVAKWDSYSQDSPIWRKMPDLMLAKCAEALALRKAFPNDLSGLYTNDEMAQADDKKPAEPKQVHEVKAVEISPEQIADAEALIKSIPLVATIEELRAIWSSESAYLDISASGTTLKEAINNRVKELTEVSAEIVDAE